MTDDPVAVIQRAPARGRILATADELFYGEGIRSVGVDRIISESAVTKATFYKHYRAKDNLIIEYITGRHESLKAQTESLVRSAKSPAAALEKFVADTADEIERPGFRGCPFINAAAEFPDPDHAVRRLVVSHREWYVDALAAVLRATGHPMPGDAADELLVARDGALSGGYAGDSVAATSALGRIVGRVLNEAGAAA